MDNLHIAYMQADICWENVAANLQAFDKRFEQIQSKVDLILFPETFNTGFSPNIIQLAEPMNGQTVGWMQKKAKETGAVIGGSLVISEKNYLVNRFLWVQPDGSYDFYDKKHLFTLSEESHLLKHGADLKTFRLRTWKIRPFICYDLRFPCWSRNSFAQSEFGYDLAVYIANWPLQRKHVWSTLLQARALENQAYIVGVNRVGEDGLGNNHIGDSMVVDAFGHIISKPPQNADCVTEIILDKKELINFREHFKVARDWDAFVLS